MWGGGCQYYNCRGGDAPRVVEEVKIKKGKTFEEMTPEEIEER